LFTLFAFEENLIHCATCGAAAGITGGVLIDTGSGSGGEGDEVAGAVLHIRDGEGLATKGDVGLLMKRLEAGLDEVGFRQNDNGTTLSKLRSLVGRVALSKREVSLLHGVVSALSATGKFNKEQ
jgi:hypothetical protein